MENETGQQDAAASGGSYDPMNDPITQQQKQGETFAEADLARELGT